MGATVAPVHLAERFRARKTRFRAGVITKAGFTASEMLSKKCATLAPVVTTVESDARMNLALATFKEELFKLGLLLRKVIFCLFFWATIDFIAGFVMVRRGVPKIM